MATHAQIATKMPVISIVVPAYNEAGVLPEFHRRVQAVLTAMALPSEIVYVDDGSTDATPGIMRELGERHANVTLVALSRNFGKEIALTAGLDHARGDAVIVIDADLQDPPEVIPELVKGWREGYDVVYARRISRQGETFLKKFTARAFYKAIRAVSRVEIPADTGDFRLLSRRALDALKTLREQHRFMKGLFAWIGFPQKAVPYHRDSRYAGESKWNYWRLWNFALEGITSFTIAPLKVATYVGIGIAFAAFLYATYMVYDTLMHGNPVAGYPSLIVIILFLGGVQLTTLGMIGEYLGRMFDETKRRPLYFIQHFQPASATSAEPVEPRLEAAAEARQSYVAIGPRALEPRG